MPSGPPVSRARAGRDIAGQVLLRGLNIALGVAVTVLVVRTLGDRGFGQWSTLLAVVHFVGYLGILGLDQVTVERASSDPGAQPAWLGSLVTLQLALSAPATRGRHGGLPGRLGRHRDARGRGRRLRGHPVRGHPRAAGRLPAPGPQHDLDGDRDGQRHRLGRRRGDRGRARRRPRGDRRDVHRRVRGDQPRDRGDRAALDAGEPARRARTLAGADPPRAAGRHRRPADARLRLRRPGHRLPDRRRAGRGPVRSGLPDLRARCSSFPPR